MKGSIVIGTKFAYQIIAFLDRSAPKESEKRKK